MSAVLNQAIRRYFQTSARRAAELGPSAVSGGHEGGYKVWRNLSVFMAGPAILLCALNCYMVHQSHHHGPPPFEKYEYLRVRTKRFPWGDGNHSLFHNKHTNPLPDGYEE